MSVKRHLHPFSFVPLLFRQKDHEFFCNVGRKPELTLGGPLVQTADLKHRL